MLIENEPYWFPMHIRYSSLSRLEQMVEHFDKEKKFLGQSVLLETYVPLNFIKVSMTKMDFAPYLLNYIFVHSTFKDLVEINGLYHSGRHDGTVQLAYIDLIKVKCKN